MSEYKSFTNINGLQNHFPMGFPMSMSCDILYREKIPINRFEGFPLSGVFTMYNHILRALRSLVIHTLIFYSMFPN